MTYTASSIWLAARCSACIPFNASTVSSALAMRNPRASQDSGNGLQVGAREQRDGPRATRNPPARPNGQQQARDGSQARPGGRGVGRDERTGLRSWRHGGIHGIRRR